MRQHVAIAGLIALGLTAATISRADEPKSEASLAQKFDQLKTDYEAADRKYHEYYQGSTIPDEDKAKAEAIRPDFPALVRGIAELAATAPKDPAVRDVMIWMIHKAQGGAGDGPYDGGFALAADWLVRHFGDDPDAVRVGLGLDNMLTPYRDHLLLGFHASSKNRESRGLARLALAQYLQLKAISAKGAREVKSRRTFTYDGVVRADGTLYTVKQEESDESYAYVLHLKQCDPAYLRDEAERLYEEVIADFGDVPFITARDRQLEALLKQPEPKQNGVPLTDEAQRQIENHLARHSTLGQLAEARLDDWHNLAVGKQAPEIEGVDVHGKPLKLSDYRGKVVALVFWGTWCGPCMREIPREKALVERMKGRPFAMLGVNTDDTPDTARETMEAEGVTWPNWHDGDPGAGPIAQLYHVHGYPTICVIDADGKIRAKNTRGEHFDKLVDELVAEREAANP